MCNNRENINLPGLDDIDGHGCDGGDEAGHHGRAEVQRDTIRDVPHEHLPRLQYISFYIHITC